MGPGRGVGGVHRKPWDQGEVTTAGSFLESQVSSPHGAKWRPWRALEGCLRPGQLAGRGGGGGQA